MDHDGATLPANRSLFPRRAWHAPAGALFEGVVNPAMLESRGQVDLAGEADINAAVGGARDGFGAWRR